MLGYFLLFVRYDLILISLFIFMLCSFEAEANEGYVASRLDGACYRSMIVSSLGKYTSMSESNGRIEIKDKPIAGDGIVLHVKFSSHGLCKKGHYALRVEASEGLKLIGKPALKGTKKLIEAGDWPDNDWFGDLMWSFSSSTEAYKSTQWVSIKLLDGTTSEKVLGGKVYVAFMSRHRQNNVNRFFVNREYKGIYIDSPNDISYLNKLYGSHFDAATGVTAFDLFSKINIHYIVVNGISKYFSMNLDAVEKEALKKETIKFFHYLKRVRPDIKIWLAVPSWRFAFPSKEFSNLLSWVNSVKAIDGLVLDWETHPSIFDDVPAAFRLVRSLLHKDKEFICTPTSFIGRRGLNWNEVDSKHSGCDIFLPMFYIPQQDDFLVTAKHWLDSWKNPNNKPSSPIIPLLIPIHKVTDNTPMPPRLMKNSVDLIANYHLPGFFVFRPYAVTPTTRKLVTKLYGDFNVDFTLDKLSLKSEESKLKISGTLINRGSTRVLFPVSLDVISLNSQGSIERKTVKVVLQDGKEGSFECSLGNPRLVTIVKLRVDPPIVYRPHRLKINKEEIFVMKPKRIDIPETDERNNNYTFRRHGNAWH